MAWRGSVWLWWCGKSVRCGLFECWSRGEWGSIHARLFFAWWCFSTLHEETFLSYLNDVIQFMLFSSPSTFGLVLLSRSTEGNLMGWFTHLNSGQWLNPCLNPSWATHIATSKERWTQLSHKWRRRATYHHPKGVSDESTATHKIEGEKHHHSNGGGIKLHFPLKGGKTAPAFKGWWNHSWVCIALSFHPFAWRCVLLSFLLVDGVCLPLSLSI